MSHTSPLFRDGCSTDKADVRVNDDVITLSSLSDVAQTQQVTKMAGIRLANVLITRTRITQPYIIQVSSNYKQ